MGQLPDQGVPPRVDVNVVPSGLSESGSASPSGPGPSTGDAALDWLLANDPEARGRIEREYGHRVGVMTPAIQNTMAANEIPMSALSKDQRRKVGFDDGDEDDPS